MQQDSTGPGTSSGAVVMVDVAREAGVSQKTVSRVVNGSLQVRPEVRDRVLATIDALGYRRNSAARALAAGRTRTIAIIAMGSPLFGIAEHVIGVERAAREQGYGTVVVATGEDGDEAEVRPAVERALAQGAEGLIFVEPLLREPAALALYADVPVVSPRRSSAPASSGSALHTHVTAAEEDGGRLAAQHLLDLGHGRIAHISGPPSWQPAVLRERGWRTALDRAGAAVPAPVRGDWSARSGYLAAHELVDRHDGTTALFAGNDAMAIGAVRALFERGLHVPGDVAVVGFDDLPESEYQVVPLSSVRQDFGEMARLSVEHIVRALDGEPLPERAMTVPARLVVRASSGDPRPGGGALG